MFTVLAPGNVRRELSTSEWRSILSRLAKFCPHFYIFGGEPFARKDVLELTRTAVQHGATVGINTNGTLLGSKGAEIVDSGLDYLMVSLDGPEDVNDKIRLGSRGFTVVTAGIRELVAEKRSRRSGFPQLELIMTLTADNQDRIVETSKIAESLGVDVFALGFGIFTTPELASVSSRQAQEEFGRDAKFFGAFVRDVSGINADMVETQVIEVRNRWRSRFKTYPPIRFRIHEYFQHPERPLMNAGCITPWLSVQIMSNGDMAFCSDFPDFVVGNVRDSDVLKLWNGSGSRAWRRRIRTKGIFPAENRCCDHHV